MDEMRYELFLVMKLPLDLLKISLLKVCSKKDAELFVGMIHTLFKLII